MTDKTIQQPLPTALSRLPRALVRRGVLAKLEGIKQGTLHIDDDRGSYRFGGKGGPVASVRVTDDAFYQMVAFKGALGAAESYMLSHWDSSELTDVIRVMALNRPILTDLEGGSALAARAAMPLLKLMSRNTLAGARRNIQSHYDLSNDLFRLFLDKQMMYSSAFFGAQGMSLDDAATAKNVRICSKLGLGPGDHLLEIGTGWGGFAIHAAKHHGCKVTTTTISDAQYAEAKQRITDEGLQGRITLLKEDYRNLKGSFNKLASIEMIEAVGAEFLPTYLRTCSSLLKDDGCMLIQAITINDQSYREALREVDFIKKYIFPGSFIPSLHAILDASAKYTDLRLYSLEDITPHYAKTLLAWRQAFLAKRDEVISLGFDDRFVRMWDYYFCYCAGGFIERAIGSGQMLFGKPGYRGDLSVRTRFDSIENNQGGP